MLLFLLTVPDQMFRLEDREILDRLSETCGFQHMFQGVSSF